MALVVTLILVGIILLALETVLPGMIAGILGACCLIAGVVIGYDEFGSHTGNLILAGVLIALVVGALLWVKYFPDSRVGRLFISTGASGELRVEKPELLNQTGTALSNLRPSGTAMIDGKRVDVVTEGSMIESGTPIKVVALEGLRVVVRAVQD